MAANLPELPSETRSLATHEKPAPLYGDQQSAATLRCKQPVILAGWQKMLVGPGFWFINNYCCRCRGALRHFQIGKHCFYRM